MKTAKLLLPLLALLAFTACGKLESEKKGNSLSLATGQWLTGTNFTQACASLGGQVYNGTTCAYVTASKALASGGSFTSETNSPYDISAVQAGQAVLTEGYSYSGSLRVAVNGVAIGNVPNSRPVTVSQSGTLQILLSPGSFYGVKAYIYACRNQGMQAVACSL